MLLRFKHFDNGNLYCVLHVCYTEKIRDLDRNKSFFDITTLYFVLLLHKVITMEFLTANKFENVFGMISTFKLHKPKLITYPFNETLFLRLPQVGRGRTALSRGKCFLPQDFLPLL